MLRHLVLLLWQYARQPAVTVCASLRRSWPGPRALVGGGRHTLL